MTDPAKPNQGSSWQAKARRRWGRQALWISGDGPFATLAHCPSGLTVVLWPTRQEAEQAIKGLICGSGCRALWDPRAHEIVDLNFLFFDREKGASVKGAKMAGSLDNI